MTVIETGFSERADYLRGRRDGEKEERERILQILSTVKPHQVAPELRFREWERVLQEIVRGAQ